MWSATIMRSRSLDAVAVPFATEPYTEAEVIESEKGWRASARGWTTAIVFSTREDVAVGLGADELDIFLHAAITCLWMIEPEDVPAIKHQGALLNRLRHGRQPHIVVVTAEMLPDRLAALGYGTGQIDGICHVALQELETAVRSLGQRKQLSLLHELVNQSRVSDVGRLAPVIARY